MSTVDVIVPCYRYGQFLRECVQSVLSQTGPAVRVLIIDDASPDDTGVVGAALAAEDRRVSLIRHATNKGHIATYNEGIEWVSADYMLLLSADDYLLPGALAVSARLMDTHRHVGFTFGKAIELDHRRADRPPDCRPVAPRWHILDGAAFIELSGANNIVPTPTAVIRTTLQKQVGGYRPELPHSGDMEMWLRLAAHASVGVVESYQAVYRMHAANMSLSYYDEGALPDLRQRQAALNCFLDSCGFLPSAQKLRRRLFWSLGSVAVGLASAALNDGNAALSQRLSAFAREVCPGINRSWPWAKMACKRRMPSVWRALQPALGRLRRALSWIKRFGTLGRARVGLGRTVRRPLAGD